MKISVEITKYRDVTLEVIDTEKTLRDYRECINEGADLVDVYTAIASFAEDDYVEGVGDKGVDYIIHDFCDYEGESGVKYL